jgi:hypothetical protein
MTTPALIAAALTATALTLACPAHADVDPDAQAYLAQMSPSQIAEACLAVLTATRQTPDGGWPFGVSDRATTILSYDIGVSPLQAPMQIHAVIFADACHSDRPRPVA